MKLQNYSYWLKLFNKVSIPKELVEIPEKDFFLSEKDKKLLKQFNIKNADKFKLRVTKKTLKALYSVKKKLQNNESLEIISAYRPPELLAILWYNRLKHVQSIFPKKSLDEVVKFAAQYTASPFHEGLPPHSRGDAVDVGLYRNNKRIILSKDETKYNEIKFEYFKGKNSIIHSNRKYLRNIMKSTKFCSYDKEYRHFGLTPIFPKNKYTKKLVTLIYPPQHMPDIPHISVPILKANLEKQGIATKAIDSNIDFYNNFALSEKNQKKAGNKNYKSLASAIKILKSPFEKNDITKYLSARINIENALNIFAKQYDSYLGLTNSGLNKYDHRNSVDVLDAINDKKNNPFIDYFNFRLKEFISSSDIVGISIGVPEQIIPSFTLAKLIRQKYKDKKIILGGNTFSRIKLEIESSKLSKLYDFGIKNEGDLQLPEVVKAIRASKSSSAIKNILQIYSQKIPDLDNEPIPDFSDFPIGKYFSPVPVLPILGGRGCRYNKCGFCAIPKMYSNNGKGRQKNPKQSFNEAKKYFKKYGVSHFKFVEENLWPSTAKTFSNLAVKNHLPFVAEAFVSIEPWILEKDANNVGKVFKKFLFGYETCSEDTIKNTSKRTKNDQSKVNQIIQHTHELGIAPFGFLMAGIPGESKKQIEKTSEIFSDNPYFRDKLVSAYNLTKWSMDSQNKIFHDKYNIKNIKLRGDLSCNYSFEIKGNDHFLQNRKIAKRMTKYIHSKRYDLAFMATLQPIARLYMFGRWGPDIGLEYIKTKGLPAKIIKSANDFYTTTKITRKD